MKFFIGLVIGSVFTFSTITVVSALFMSSENYRNMTPEEREFYDNEQMKALREQQEEKEMKKLAKKREKDEVS